MDNQKHSDKNPDRDYAFWNSHGGVGIVWSNPNASDSIMILHALLRPTFMRLLEIAAHFGLERLEKEWQSLRSNAQQIEELVGIERVKPIVDRYLMRFRDAAQRGSLKECASEERIHARYNPIYPAFFDIEASGLGNTSFPLKWHGTNRTVEFTHS